MTPMTARTRWARVGVGGGCLAVAMGFAAGPALGALADHGQPPPGTEVPKTTDFVPGEQPPAGASVAKTTDFVPEAQPANPHPEPPTGLTTQVAPDEPDSGVRSGPDQGDPNLSSSPE